ncbi:Amino-acid acetyltransferase [Limihaloglobus sulfuriphilus]|uniref:Amino-acid acetyltransferase n=1 Tax=Limihaloglobus sulfuriphilus TaxID=1851148 RepID=A0A1Q2MHB6_9BACT|nr:N-acetyltransferase [Limihaloglobus sulfuriphilus]AQQ71652.1 Amino-acid acetyltransferase [Limihaloglobus sulfuriphilus]
MIIRQAKTSDAEAINELISRYAELDKMLFRSMASIYELIQTFAVAEEDGRVLGCGALSVVWKDLAEIKSLAVAEGCQGKGIGRSIVEFCLEKARSLGIKDVFALTLEPQFFEKLGFHRVNRLELPMKVWSDCAMCPKQDNCDEIALVISLK